MNPSPRILLVALLALSAAQSTRAQSAGTQSTPTNRLMAFTIGHSPPAPVERRPLRLEWAAPLAARRHPLQADTSDILAANGSPLSMLWALPRAFLDVRIPTPAAQPSTSDQSRPSAARPLSRMVRSIINLDAVDSLSAPILSRTFNSLFQMPTPLILPSTSLARSVRTQVPWSSLMFTHRHHYSHPLHPARPLVGFSSAELAASSDSAMFGRPTATEWPSAESPAVPMRQPNYSSFYSPSPVGPPSSSAVVAPTDSSSGERVLSESEMTSFSDHVPAPVADSPLPVVAQPAQPTVAVSSPSAPAATSTSTVQ